MLYNLDRKSLAPSEHLASSKKELITLSIKAFVNFKG